MASPANDAGKTGHPETEKQMQPNKKPGHRPCPPAQIPAKCVTDLNVTCKPTYNS